MKENTENNNTKWNYYFSCRNKSNQNTDIYFEATNNNKPIKRSANYDGGVCFCACSVYVAFSQLFLIVLQNYLLFFLFTLCVCFCFSSVSTHTCSVHSFNFFSCKKKRFLTSLLFVANNTNSFLKILKNLVGLLKQIYIYWLIKKIVINLVCSDSKSSASYFIFNSQLVKQFICNYIRITVKT